MSEAFALVKRNRFWFAGSVLVFATSVVWLLVVWCQHNGEICERDEYSNQKTCATYGFASFAVNKVTKTLDQHAGAIQALTAVLVAGFTWSLLLATRRQALSMRRQTTIMRDQVKAERAHLTCMTDDITVAGLYATDPAQKIYPPDSYFPSVTLKVKSLGRSPAWIKRAGFEFRVTKQDLPAQPIWPNGHEAWVEVIPPGGEINISQLLSDESGHSCHLTQAQRSEVLASDSRLYIYGFIEYRDIFERPKNYRFSGAWIYLPAGGIYPERVKPCGPDSYWEYT